MKKLKKQTLKQTLVPISSLPDMLTYSREPTASEIRFGHGARHYLDFKKEDYLKENGYIKKRIRGKDGLIYTRY